jgi:membrane protease YdiL (CAAX protease family)
MIISPKTKVGLAFLIFILAYYVLPDILSQFNDSTAYESKYWLIYLQLIYGVSSYILILFLTRKHDEYGLKIVKFNWRKVFLVTSCIQTIPLAMFLIELTSDTLYLSGWMLLSLTEVTLIYVILAPLAEELFFRGLIQTLLSPLLQFKLRIRHIVISTPVIVTTILFAFIHASYSAGALVFIVLLGVLCGYLREKYHSLVPALFAHFVFNVFAVFIPRAVQVFIESSYER